MKRAGAVALNTFREAVRDRVLYSLLFFALLMMAAAIFVGQISIGIEEMVIKSLGLSGLCTRCWPSRCGAGSFCWGNSAGWR